jgi:hypothetical protein
MCQVKCRETRGHAELWGAAASGDLPPAGPQWKQKEARPLAFVGTTEVTFGGALRASKDALNDRSRPCP